MGDGARGGGVGVGRLGGVEARRHFLDEAEEERRVEGAVPAEEGGVGDDAAEARARSAGQETRRRISSRRSSARAASCLGDAGASRQRQSGDGICRRGGD